MHRLELGAVVEDPLAPYAEVDRSTPDGRCWVTGHMVAGLDGCAAIRAGWVRSPPRRTLSCSPRCARLPTSCCVGAETVRLEGYGRIRLPPERTSTRTAQGLPATPPLAVVSRSLNLNWESRAFTGAPPESRTIVVTCAAAPAERLARAREVADVLVAGEVSVDPGELMTQLASRGLQRVLCEGGPTWLGELVMAGLLDELCLSIAPMMGGDPLPVAVFPPGAALTEFTLRHVLRADSTVFLRYERASRG